MKFVLGITGGSGSGKSTLCQFLKNNGALVIDADIVAREIVAPFTPALEEIKEVFGDDIILPDGTLDRKKLGQLVFSDKQKLNILNSITHKYIIEKIKVFTKENEDFLVIDAALLFETGLDKLCDKTIAVLANEDARAQRIQERDGLMPEHAKDRISSQHTEDYYNKKADYILTNDGSVKDLEKKASCILKEIM